MPNFTFTSPDGKQYTVTGPDGATADQAFQILQKQLGTSQARQPGYIASDTGKFTPISTAVQQAKTTTPFEAAAVPVGAALLDTGRSLGHLTNLIAASQSPGMLPAAMQANSADQASIDKQEQDARDAAAAQNPHAYYGLYAPTSILSMAPLGEGVGGAAAQGVERLIPATPEAIAAAKALGKAVPIGTGAGRNLLPKIAANAMRSGATGAAYGAQMPGDTLTNIETGAALGPLGEGAIKGVTLGARFGGTAFNAASDLSRQMFNPEQEAQNTVRKIVQESATGNPLLTPSPVPGVNLSAGGQSLDPGLQNLEQVIRSRNVGGVGNEAVAQAQQRQNNSIIRGRFGQIASINTPLQKASTDAADALNEAQDARKAQETELWKQVPENTQVDAAKTSSAIDSYINKQSVTNQRVIQRAAGDFIGDFRAAVAKYAQEGDEGTQVKMPFQEVKDLRSTLGQAIRDAQNSGNSNAVRLLRGMDDKLLSTLGDENALLGAPDATGALGSAQAKLNKMNGVVTAQDLGDSYNAARNFTAQTHGNYFTKDVQGFLKQDPAKMLDSVTKTPENMKAYLNAASQAPDGGAKATQALRDYLLSKGIDSASMSARGGTEKFLNGQTMKDWLQANQGVLSHVFSSDELNQMDQLADASYRNIATEAATPRVGSNTLQKFIGNQNLPGLPGKVGAAANSIRDMLVGSYRGKTEQLLRDTLFDPQNQNLQQMLDQPMTPANMNKLVSYMKTVPALKDKVPLLFNAALHAPATGTTRLLTQPAQQGAP